MVILHRAVQAEDKATRRAAILGAAEALIVRDPENFAAVADVAEAAGLAKGTVYLYFRSKEELVLAVHAQHSERMFDLLDRLLTANAGRPMQAWQVVDSFCGFATGNPLFLHLGAACHSSFQRHIDPEVMYQFRAAIAARLAHFGPLIEARFPALGAGDGVAVLTSIKARLVRRSPFPHPLDTGAFRWRASYDGVFQCAASGFASTTAPGAQVTTRLRPERLAW